jgi:hypothetical protein
MSDASNNAMNPELKSWMREQLDAAVSTLNEKQVFDDALVESRPAWVLPMQILLGKARAHNDPAVYQWFIRGDVPFDHIDSSAAATPREALRHFAMKWQITAESLDKKSAESLIGDAERLYNLTEDDRFWTA